MSRYKISEGSSLAPSAQLSGREKRRRTIVEIIEYGLYSRHAINARRNREAMSVRSRAV